MRYIFLWVLFWANCCIAYAECSNSSDIRSDVLPNGFSYFIQRNGIPANRIFIKLIVKTGFFNERPDQSQVAHVIEHLAFQKTAHFSSVSAFFGEKGLIFGVDANAATGFRSTSYWLSIPSKDLETFKQSIQLVRDWCDGIIFDSAAIEAERGNVLNEIGKPSLDVDEMEKTNSVLLGSEKFNVSYKSAVNSIRNFKANALIEYYTEWYKPNLQGIVVVGDIDVSQVFSIVKDKFGDLKGYKNDSWQDLSDRAIVRNGNFVRENNWFRREVVVDLYYKHKGFLVRGVKDQKRVAGIELYNRMIQDRSNRIKCSNIVVSVCKYQRGAIMPDAGIDALMNTVIVRSSGSDEAEVQKAIKCYLREQRRIAKYGFTEQEFLKARESLLAEFNMGSISSFDLVNLYESHYLGDGLDPGDKKLHDKVEGMVKSIKPSDVVEAFNEWRSNITPDIVIRTSKDLASLSLTEQIIRNCLNEVESEEIFPYVQEEERKLILPDSIINAIERSGSIYGVTDYENVDVSIVNFQNGVELIVKPIKQCNDCKSKQIIVNGFKPRKEPGEVTDNYYSAIYAGQSVMPGLMTRNDLNILEQNKGFVITPYVSDRDVGFHCYSDISDVKILAEMIYAFFKYPRLDREGFLNFRNSLSDRLTLRETGYDSFLISKKNAISNIPRKEDFISLTPEASFSYFTKLFSDAYGFRFVVTGDFDRDSLIHLFDNYLSCLPARNKSEWPIARRQFNAGPCQMFLSSTNERAGASRFNFDCFVNNATGDVNEQAQIAIFCRLLNMKLFRRLREQMGVAYSVGTGNDKLYGVTERISISFSTVNENHNDIIGAVYEEFEELIKKGANSEDLHTAINLERASMQKEFEQQHFWQQYLYDQSMTDSALDEVLSKYSAVSLVNSDMVRQIAVKILKCGQFKVLKFSDFLMN